MIDRGEYMAKVKYEMQSRIDCVDDREIEQHIALYKQHYDVIEISKEYSSNKRKRLYIRYNACKKN